MKKTKQKRPTATSNHKPVSIAGNGCWWIERRSLSDLPQEEQDKFWAGSGGFLPEEAQDREREIIRPKYKAAFDRARTDLSADQGRGLEGPLWLRKREAEAASASRGPRPEMSGPT
jgi:hypothetical protein